MPSVFKFVLDLFYDCALVYGSLYIIHEGLQVIKYFIQTQHEERMTQLNDAFLRQQDRLLK